MSERLSLLSYFFTEGPHCSGTSSLSYFFSEQPLIWAASALSYLPASSSVASATNLFSARSWYNAFSGPHSPANAFCGEPVANPRSPNKSTNVRAPLTMWAIPRYPAGFSRMRSRGSRFTLGVWGLSCVRQTFPNRPQLFAIVRNRSREVAMAVPMVSSAKRSILCSFAASCRFVSRGRRGTL